MSKLEQYNFLYRMHVNEEIILSEELSTLYLSLTRKRTQALTYGYVSI